MILLKCVYNMPRNNEDGANHDEKIIIMQQSDKLQIMSVSQSVSQSVSVSNLVC